ncbi:MAG: signal peptidase I [Butyrivibrio sp.]|nr:signal peptidase I [Butyrivibrio sp.]
MHDSGTQSGNTDEIIEIIEVNMEEFAGASTPADSSDCAVAESAAPAESVSAADESEAGGESEPRSRRFAKELCSYLIIIASAVFIAVVINKLVIINAHIPSSSMVPTLKIDDRLIGLRLAYLFSEPKRGDVVIFEHSFSEGEKKETLVKRIIGTPGDSILIDDEGVFVNGERLSEDYLAEPMNVLSALEFTVPENAYFVMGDNRNVSYDSRMWANTYVARDEIIARALFKYYPRLEKIE